jgi:hypothetical protein
MSEGQAAEHLHAIGSVLGVTVTVSDGDEWLLDEHGLRVGLNWYLQRGHGGREAAALAALQLWEGPLEPRRAPDRARRWQALAQVRPHLISLLGAVRRAQAMGELLAAMPGLRAPLQAAVFRGLPRDLGTLPRHLQWASLVLAQAVPQSDEIAIEDSAVAAEWQAVLAASSESGSLFHTLDRVLAPRTDVAPLRRFERALTLVLPAYERLLALDTLDFGSQATVLGGSDRADLSLHADEALGSEDFALGCDEQSAEPDTDDSQPADNDSQGTPDPDQLFEAERDQFAQTVLATPISDASALFAGDAEATPFDTQQIESEKELAGGAGAGRPASGVSLAEYRSRAQQLAAAIDRTRAIWRAVIAERIAPRRVHSRMPQAEGDELVAEALAAVVAQTLAGVPEPAAFRRREVKPRLTRSAGSTDYVLMIDRSASMTGAVADAAADAALVMVEALAAAERDIAHAERSAGIDLELDIRSCLIVFSSDATVVKPLSRGLDDATRRSLYSEVRSPAGSTNDAAALRAAGEQLGIGAQASHPADGLARRRIAILVGDGGTNDAPAAARELQRLRAAGVSVHGVGIGTADLATRYAPQGASIASASELPKVLARIIEHEL